MEPEIIPLVLDDIPTELLVSNILKYFNKTERQQLRRVSQRWKESIDNFFGQAIRLTKSNWEDVKYSAHVKRAIVEHWSEDMYPAAQDLAGALEELEIRKPDDTAVHCNLVPLLASCHNVKTLILHKISDENCDPNEANSSELMSEFEVEETDSLFPSIKTLKFIDDQSLQHVRYRSFTSMCCDRPFDILRFIFQTLGTKNLRNVDVTMINQNWGLPLAIVFHVNPVTEIVLSRENTLTIPILELGVERLSQLESFILRTHAEQVAICMYFHANNIKHTSHGEQERPRRQLRKFTKCGYIKESKSPRNNFINNVNMSYLWMDILGSQFHLEELEYEFLCGEPDPNFKKFADILQKNQKSIRSLKLFSMSRRSFRSYLWSGSDFSDLKKLQSLSLVNFFRFLDFTDSDYKQHLVTLIKELECLPPTLKYLELYCPFDAGEQDVSASFKSLSNLETLKLISNQADKPWWSENGNPKYILDKEELGKIIGSLRAIKVIEMCWCPPSGFGAAAVAHTLHGEDKVIEIAGRKVNLQYFPRFTVQYNEEKQVFRKMKADILQIE